MCRDGHICQRACSHTQPRDPVHSLNVEGVASEHCKVQYCYRGASNAEWPWDKVQVRLARLTLCHSTTAVTPTTALAQYVVSDVLSASCITGRHPLQEESCVIDEWDQVPGSWWRPWKREEKYLETDIFFFFFGDCTCHFLRWIFSRTLMRPWIWSNGWHMITIIWQVCTLSIFLFLSMCVQCVGTASVWVVGFQHFRLHSSNLCQFPG